jgi:hypothetical protein
VSNVARAGTTVTVELTADVLDGTVDDALSAQVIDTAAATPAWATAALSSITSTPAWATAALSSITSTPAQGGSAATITFDLPSAPTGQEAYRVVLAGTGPTPLAGLVGTDAVPLAGRVGGPSGTADEGHDAVITIKEDAP